MKDATLVFLATLVPFAAIVLTACVIALANLDTYDPPTYEWTPPRRSEAPTVVLPAIRPAPTLLPVSPKLGATPIIDAYLGVLDAPSTPATPVDRDPPIFDRLAAGWALALDMPPVGRYELVGAR